MFRRIFYFFFYFLVTFTISSQSLESTYDPFSSSSDFLDGTTIQSSLIESKKSSNDFVSSDFISVSYIDSKNISENFIDAKFIEENYIESIYTVNLLNYDYENCFLKLPSGEKIQLKKILRNVGVAEGVMLISAVVLTPISGGQSITAFIVSWHLKALAGAAFDAAISGIGTYISSKGNIDKTAKSVIEGASEGYMWGAIFAVGEDAIKTVKICHERSKIVSRTDKIQKENFLDKNINFVEKFEGDVFSYAKKAEKIPFSENSVRESYEYINSLPKKSKDVIYEYTTEKYKIYNDITRVGKSTEKTKLLDSSLRGHIINEPYTTYRYAGDNLCGNILVERNNKLFWTIDGKSVELGGRTVEKGFMSTSTHPTFTRDFAHGDVPYRIVLNCPKNSRGLYVANISMAPAEGELLKPTGTKMEILRYEWNENLRVWDIFAREIL